MLIKNNNTDELIQPIPLKLQNYCTHKHCFTLLKLSLICVTSLYVKYCLTLGYHSLFELNWHLHVACK